MKRTHQARRRGLQAREPRAWPQRGAQSAQPGGDRGGAASTPRPSSARAYRRAGRAGRGRRTAGVRAQPGARGAAARRCYGPAGLAVYGPEVQSPDELARQSIGGSLRFARIELGRQTKQTCQHPCSAAPRSRRSSDPGERARHAAPSAPPATRRARRTSRRTASPIHISRLSHARQDPARRGPRATSTAAASPRIAIFGVYRVPDRISQALTPHSERAGRSSGTSSTSPIPAGPSAPLVATVVRRRRAVGRAPAPVSRRCSTRSSRSRSASSAGIGPEQCAGLARVLGVPDAARWRRRRELARPVCTLVRGVVAVHPQAATRAPTSACAPPRRCSLHRTAAASTSRSSTGHAIAVRGAHPCSPHPPSVPSPFPYLPATPQELLRAYLEVVGVQPERLLQRPGDRRRRARAR